MKKGNCVVLKATEHAHSHVGNEESGCFYWEPLPVHDLAQSFKEKGGEFTVRAARIEVKDTEVGLHKHEGATIAFITAGAGMFKTSEGDVSVQTGDVIYIPAMTPHLSIADKGTVMIEHIVYLGGESDWQASLEA